MKEKLIFIFFVFFLVTDSLKAFQTSPIEPLEMEYQVLLPPNSELIKVQHLNLSGTPQKIVFVFYILHKDDSHLSNVAVFTHRQKKACKLWEGEPNDEWIDY